MFAIFMQNKAKNLSPTLLLLSPSFRHLRTKPISIQIHDLLPKLIWKMEMKEKKSLFVVQVTKPGAIDFLFPSLQSSKSQFPPFIRVRLFPFPLGLLALTWIDLLATLWSSVRRGHPRASPGIPKLECLCSSAFRLGLPSEFVSLVAFNQGFLVITALQIFH